jgi:hypothetical protein
VSALQLASVVRDDCGARCVLGRELHEAKSTRALRFAVHHHVGRHDLAVRGERFAELRAIQRVRQVSDKQFPCHEPCSSTTRSPVLAGSRKHCNLPHALRMHCARSRVLAPK